MEGNTSATMDEQTADFVAYGLYLGAIIGLYAGLTNHFGAEGMVASMVVTGVLAVALLASVVRGE